MDPAMPHMTIFPEILANVTQSKIIGYPTPNVESGNKVAIPGQNLTFAPLYYPEPVFLKIFLPIAMQPSQKIYVFTKYSAKGPSSRYRTFQYIPIWQKEYDIEINELLGDWYFCGGNHLLRKFFLLCKSFLKRYILLRKITPNDIVWIEYELFPYLGTQNEKMLKKKGIPFILDYDDAIFHHYDNHPNFLVRKLLGKKIRSLVKLANFVITGSPYLTNYVKLAQPRTIEIPTSINPMEYDLTISRFEKEKKGIFIVGWLGSYSTSFNLTLIVEAFASFSKKYQAELWLMGFDERMVEMWEGLPVRFFKWGADVEKRFLNTIDVGVMPLVDLPFAHGKCGFKLIQYMAMGKPTISTPMEANLKIDRERINFFASTTKEWEEAFETIAKVGTGTSYNGNRKVVEEFYNIHRNGNVYLDLFKRIKELDRIN